MTRALQRRAALAALSVCVFLVPTAAGAQERRLDFLCAAAGDAGSFQHIACGDYLDALFARDAQDAEVESIQTRAVELAEVLAAVPAWPIRAESPEEAQFFRDWLRWSQDTLEADVARLAELVSARQRFALEATVANLVIEERIARLEASDDLWDLPKAVLLRNLALVDVAAEQAVVAEWVAFQRELNELASAYYAGEVESAAAAEEPPARLARGSYSLRYADGVRRSTLWNLNWVYDDDGALDYVEMDGRRTFECEGGSCSQTNGAGVTITLTPAGDGFAIDYAGPTGSSPRAVRGCYWVRGRGCAED